MTSRTRAAVPSRAQGATRVETGTRPRPHDPARPLRRVLVVDDDRDVLEIATVALEVGGLHVDVCHASVEAAGLVLAQKPDLILLDAMMPQRDGLAVMRELRADPRTARIPIVFLTARVMVENVAEYLALGADGVLAKPFEPIALPRALQDFWAGR